MIYIYTVYDIYIYNIYDYIWVKSTFFILFAVFLQPLTRRQMPGLPRRGPAVLASLAFLAAEAFLTSAKKKGRELTRWF